MKRLILSSIVLVAMSAGAFGTTINDLTLTLSPSIEDPASETYPLGLDQSTYCDSNNNTGGSIDTCVVFYGTITDDDPDSTNLMILENLSLTFNNPSQSVYLLQDPYGDTFGDNTYSNNVPLLLQGTGGSFSDSYTGPIFGIDLAVGTPAGTYEGTAVLSAEGGDDDPLDNGFIVTVPFTVVIAPEPSSGLMIIGALAGIVAWRRTRRPRPC